MNSCTANKLNQFKVNTSKCARCYLDIPNISYIFNKFTKLPIEVSKIIINYFELGDQYIGYVLLHKPVYNRFHTMCVNCTKKHIDYISSVYTPCPYFKCNKKINVLQISQNLID